MHLGAVYGTGVDGSPLNPTLPLDPWRARAPVPHRGQDHGPSGQDHGPSGEGRGNTARPRAVACQGDTCKQYTSMMYMVIRMTSRQSARARAARRPRQTRQGGPALIRTDHDHKIDVILSI